MPPQPSLNPSELGTKEYWETFYTNELHNHTTNTDDEGTIWFSESDAEGTVLRLLDKLASSGLIHRTGAKESRFLDLGTGNGHMLFLLREGESDDDDDDDDDDAARWEGEMVGVDYSSASVDLARRIAEEKGSGDALSFECWDLLQSPPGEWLGEGFDVVLDKGTFDAISLMESARAAEHPCDVYRERVAPLVKEGGVLVVTSCNWTKEELLGWLSIPEDSGLQFFDEAKYPTFMFGGKTGQSIVTLVFQRTGG